MFFLYFSASFVLSAFFTALVIWVMKRFGIVDRPKQNERKIHQGNIPLGGGIAIFLGFFLVTLGTLLFTNHLGHEVLPRHVVGLFFGGLILMVGGFLDDKYILRPRYQICFPILAALVITFFGIGTHGVTNPFRGTIPLDQWLVAADIIVFCWLMGLMFTTKFLDGLDGVVTGIVAIGAFMIFFLSLQDAWYQREVATLAIIFAGACLGFLVWNWHPAKIFLGEGGSLFTGFLLGSLAILSQGKIATTLLVVGIPMLDAVRVIVQRLRSKRPVYVGDKEHLHFKLLNSGLSHRQAVLLLYTISLLFGISTLFLQFREKMIALLFLLILMLLLGVWFSREKYV